MSLALPHVLDAAAAVAPDAQAAVNEQTLPVSELNHRTIKSAERWLHDGRRPGDRVEFAPPETSADVIEMLGAVRIGLVVGDAPVAPTAPVRGPSPGRHVVESCLWSATPMAVLGGRTWTHGEVITGIDDPVDFALDPLLPLLEVLRSIAATMTSAPIPVHRGDGELLGHLAPCGDGWEPRTVFGLPLAGPMSADEAEEHLRTHGLSSLAEPWELLHGSTWIRVDIAEAGPRRVTVSFADFGRPELYGTRLTLCDPTPGILRRA